MAKVIGEVKPDSPKRDFARYVVDEADKQRFFVHKDVFTDHAVFGAEISRLFENSWSFLAHDSQLPQKHDFLTLKIGRQPVILSRDGDGALHCVLNRCTHRGAMVCREEQGNASRLRCFYHSWTFDSAGRLVAVADRAGYPDDFDMEAHDLVPIARLAVYRGLIFGSLSPAVGSLEAHLGKAKPYLDFLLDKYPPSIALARGTSVYGYPGNWKLQVENAMDYYHLPFIHQSFIDIRKARGEPTPPASISAMNKDFALYLGNGHGTVITRADPQAAFDQHLFLFPNLVILERPAPQFRVVHPVAADRTIVKGYAFLPVGANDATRDDALRKYEIFYGPVGFGTPDDIEVFEACMAGYACEAAPWNDLSRGIHREMTTIDLNPVFPFDLAGTLTDDTVFRGLYRFWARRMNGAA